MTVTKVFSEKLYAQDDNAKYQILDWLNNHGYQAKINPDKYGIDIIANKNGIKYFFEVEVKHPWKGEEFPFPEGVDFVPRKKKLAKANSYFVMLNHERDNALVINGTAVLESPIVVKDSIYTSGERFIRIPLEKCVFIRLGDKNVEQ
jgi:hypothetical protein